MTQLSKSNISLALHNLKNPDIILSPDDVSQSIRQTIPDSWLNLLSLGNVNFSEVYQLWHPVADKMPNLMVELERTLQGIAILTQEDKPPALLYIFVGQNKEFYFYQGFPPLKDSDIPPNIAMFWYQLPPDFRSLYTIHNGWIDTFDSMGHLPIDKLLFFSKNNWYPDELDSLPFNPEKTVFVCQTGGSGYLGFELPKYQDTRDALPLIWWTSTPSCNQKGIEVFPILDELISAQFETNKTSLSKHNISQSLGDINKPQIWLSPDELSQEIIGQIPMNWLNLLSVSEIDLSKLRNLWQPVAAKIPNVMKELERTLQGLAILTQENKPPALLYIFFAPDQTLYCYQGFPPIEDSDIPQKLAPIWCQLPADFRSLYTIHNGWVYTFDNSLGHLPIEQLYLKYWEKWNCSDKPVVWWTDKSFTPGRDIEFLSMYDCWISDQFKDNESR